MDDIQSGMIKAAFALLLFISVISFIFMAERGFARLNSASADQAYEKVLYV